MVRIQLGGSLEAECSSTASSHFGDIFHVEYNSHGGSNATPIAKFWVCRPPVPAEGFRAHWQVNCYVRVHPMSPPAALVGQALVHALVREGKCAEPIWLSNYLGTEVEGQEFGEVFSYD